MATSKEYLKYVLEQLSGLEEIGYRAMMGEYVIYYKGKVAGGLYDDRLMVKATESGAAYMPSPVYEQPYQGAKQMLLVEETDDPEFLAGLFEAMYEELPEPKPRKKRK